MLMSGEYNNTSNNFRFYINQKSIFKEQNIRGDYRDWVNKRSDAKSYVRDSLSKLTS